MINPKLLFILLSASLFADEGVPQLLTQPAAELEASASKSRTEEIAALCSQLQNQIAALEGRLSEVQFSDLKAAQKNLIAQVEALQADWKREQEKLAKTSDLRMLDSRFLVQLETLKAELESQEKHLAAEVQDVQSQMTQMQSAQKMAEKPAIFNYRQPLDFTGFTLFGDYLLFGVSQQASTYVLTPKGSVDTTEDSDGLGKYHSAEFDWNSGFRVGLGYTFCGSHWQMLTQYTRFTTSGSAKHSLGSDTSKPLIPTLRDASVGSQLSHASETTHLGYQVGDLLFTRQIFADKSLLFSFNMGATGAWIDEDWNVHYHNVDASRTHIRNDWSFNGGGIRLGIDANWYMGWGFGMYSKLAAAAYAGTYRNDRKITTTNNEDSNDLNPLAHTHFSQLRLQPMGQIALGLDWGKTFKSWGVRLMVGGEVNTWFDLHQYLQAGDSTEVQQVIQNQLTSLQASNVSLYGLTTRLSFDF